MPEQHLLPFALPHGRAGSTGFVTVYFAPRLKESGPLSDYPAWLNWAATVNALNIQILVDGLPRPSTRVGITADPNIWAATFAPNTPVDPHRFEDWSETPLLTVPTSDFNDAVLDLYARVAAEHPDTIPSGSQLVARTEAGVLTDRNGALDAAVEYVRPMKEGDDELLEEPRDPEWGFHDYISLLGHHPELLRHLGIAVDLEVELPAGVPTTVLARTDFAGPSGNGGATGRREVRIIMRTTPDFTSLPNPSADHTEQTGGFLRFEDQDAYLSILDTYSAAGRLHRFDEQFGELGSQTGGSGALPALTTRALTLVRPDLLVAFTNRTKRQLELEEALQAQLDGLQGPVEVFAEDVSIGFQLDVLDVLDDGVWRSLFQRRTDEAGYRFPADPSLDLTPAPDEGWTTTLLATDVDEQLPPINEDVDLPVQHTAMRRLDDQLYRWDGWSGAARPPGGALDGTTGELANIAPNEPDPGEPVQFAASYEVLPGTLPALRFGRTYRMRARCVDLAGNSPALASASPKEVETPEETFGRLEPVIAPFVVRRTPRPEPGVGDDAVTLVLRSDYDVDDSAVASQERLLFPGQVGQDLCQLHGVPNGGTDPASYRELARRDAAAPQDRWSVDSATGEPIATGRPRQSVGYLSDPFAERLRAYHYGEHQEHLVDVAGTWPAVTSTRIEAVAGEGPTEVAPAPSTELRFHVAKADITAIDLSYAPPAGAAEQFGLWHRLEASEQDELRTTIENGGHWMFSARRPIRLVHAVRRPLLAPRVESWEQERAERSTGITITTTMQADRRSTGQVTLRARWTDLVDDLDLDAPVPRDGGARLGRFETARSEATTFTVTGHRAELGDTRRHAATIDIEAFSSFSSYFTEERVVTTEQREPVLVDRRGFASGTVSVRYGPDQVEARVGADYTTDDAAGTVLANSRGKLPPGTDITVRYVPLPTSRRSDEHPAFEVVFPNTATPPRPVVSSVLPAFARSRAEVEGATTVDHDGRVVRVYLARPWNITGDGECLAVLADPNGTGEAGATRLGRDPVVGAGSTLAALTAASLTGAHTVTRSEDQRHDLALHTVTYDEQRGAWFADIAVDTGVYRPFLQLVIARFQTDSIDGKRLGPTVTLDPARLGVSRHVVVTPDGDRVEVRVSGVEHAGIPTGIGGDGATDAPNEVTVTVQEADLSIADPDLRWLSDTQTVTLDRSTGPEGTVWSGLVELPPSGLPRRLVIEELEPAPFGGEAPALAGSVVYTEVVELPAP